MVGENPLTEDTKQGINDSMIDKSHDKDHGHGHHVDNSEKAVRKAIQNKGHIHLHQDFLTLTTILFHKDVVKKSLITP